MNYSQNTQTHVLIGCGHARAPVTRSTLHPRTPYGAHATRMTSRTRRTMTSRTHVAVAHAVARTARTRPAPSRTYPTTRTPSTMIAPATTRQDDPMQLTRSEGRHGTNAHECRALAATESPGPLHACILSTQPFSGDATATQWPCKSLAKRRARAPCKGVMLAAESAAWERGEVDLTAAPAAPVTGATQTP